MQVTQVRNATLLIHYAGTRFLITLEGTTAHVMAPLEIDA